MELLDLLEQRISVLLNKMGALTAENESLKRQLTQELTSLADENTRLQNELDQERERNNTALTRIEALAERIKEQTDQE